MRINVGIHQPLFGVDQKLKRLSSGELLCLAKMQSLHGVSCCVGSVIHECASGTRILGGAGQIPSAVRPVAVYAGLWKPIEVVGRVQIPIILARLSRIVYS